MDDPQFSRVMADSNLEWVGLLGILVPVPAEWNLRVYRGDARRGMLAFTDLRDVRLEVRWRPGRQNAVQLTQRVQRAEPGGTIHELSRDARLIARESGTDILAAGPAPDRRIYELRFPAPCDEAVIRSCAESFLRAQRLLSTRSDRLWCVYGASGWVPESARAKAIILLPGRTELRLGYRGGSATLGAFSLADRLLAGRTLLAWAQGWERTSKLPGRWEQSGSDGAVFHGAVRRWGRRRVHHIVLRHDPRANRLAWDHRIGRG